MHILTVSLDYPPTVGGIPARVFELCQTLVALDHEPTVLAKKLPFAHFMCSGRVALNFRP